MLRLAADENFNGDIVRGLLRRVEHLDLQRVQDANLSGAEDPIILEWAAGERRVLLTHDRKTVPRFAYQRVEAGLSMTGVIVVSDRLSVGRAIEDLVILAECSLDDEWAGKVISLPW